MIRDAIQSLVSGSSLSMDEAAQVMSEIMDGEATPAQIGAFITALRIKDETPDEIAGMASVMREKALQVESKGMLVDTCGTGGDASGTFNISTTAALVVAGAGQKVAKHGNRAMSGSCGSADVLEALGVKIDLSPPGVERCLEEVGIGFMFAPVFHPAMKHAAGPRREIGVRTVFNVLGPLTNPARAQAQVLGIADASLGEKMAAVLDRLGCKHALIVHGEDGLDEITPCGESRVWELKQGTVSSYTVRPEELGLSQAQKDSVKGGDVEVNRDILLSVLRGEKGAARDAVLMNAAAALVASEGAETLLEGVVMASAALDSGKALQTLEGLAQLSQTLS